MSFELVNTSVAKGLKPGSRGFTTVAFTDGMPANYVQLCESLSGYVHVYGLEDPRYGQNPPAYSHLVSTVGGRTFSILSKVASYRKDYTGRSNKLAHHFMFKVEERTACGCGPAVAMDGGRIFFDKWEEEPKHLPENRVRLKVVAAGLRATHWEKAFGDPNKGCAAAGALAQAFLDSPDRPSFIIFEPGMDLLPLIAEAQALLPEERRWDVTFSTYFTALPVGMKCAWRGCLPKSDALVTARRTPGTLVINLIDKTIEGAPSDQSLAEVARTGKLQVPIAGIQPPPALPTIEAAPVQSMPSPRAGGASPRRPLVTLDYGKVLKPEPPIQKKQKRPIIGPIPIVISLLVIGCVVTSFFIPHDLFKRKAPESRGEQLQPPETGLAQEAELPTPAVSPAKPSAPKEASSPSLPESPTEQKPTPVPEAKPSANAIILGHIEDGTSNAAPVSITFWDVNAVFLTNASSPSASDGSTNYGMARYQRGKFSSIPASVTFFRAEYTNGYIVLFAHPVQATLQLDSTNVIFPQGDGRELLKSWIGKCTNTISANLFRGGAGFKAEVPDRESMRIVLLADQIDPWNKPVKEAEGILQNLQKQLEEARRRVQEFDGRWKQLAEQYAAADNETDKKLKDDNSQLAIRGYAEYVNQVRQFIKRYEGLVKPLQQPKSKSLNELLALENQREHEEFSKPTLSLHDAEFTARNFNLPLLSFCQDLGGAVPQANIKQAEVALTRAQNSSAPTKAEILLDGRVIVEATLK